MSRSVDLPEGFEDSGGAVEVGGEEPLGVVALQDVSGLLGHLHGDGFGQRPPCEVNQPDHLLLALWKIENRILYEVNQMAQLVVVR